CEIRAQFSRRLSVPRAVVRVKLAEVTLATARGTDPNGPRMRRTRRILTDLFPPVVYSGGAFSNYGGLQMRLRRWAICLIALFAASSGQETGASKQLAPHSRTPICKPLYDGAGRFSSAVETASARPWHSVRRGPRRGHRGAELG